MSSAFAVCYEIFMRDQPATALYPNVTRYVIPHWLEGLSSPFRADPVVNLEFATVAP